MNPKGDTALKKKERERKKRKSKHQSWTMEGKVSETHGFSPADSAQCYKDSSEPHCSLISAPTPGLQKQTESINLPWQCGFFFFFT